MGMGKSSGSQSQQVQLTPEQRETLAIQNAALKNTFLPAYEGTVQGAKEVMSQTMPAASTAAQQAIDVAGQTGNLQQVAGSAGLVGGMAGLASLFDPQYERQQVQAALQEGREATREQLAGQNAMYGAAGGLGGARQALADENLAQLGAQRQATAAAAARAGVQANKAAAAQQLMSAGQGALTGANQAAAARIGYAGTPQDVYSKYASVVYGVPQASTTPNYAGTQSSTGQSSGKGMGFNFGSK